MDASAPTARDGGSLIEEDKRFSESILWQLQRRFYDQRGPNAWSTGTVPSYVTSNPYIAQVYAHIVLAFLRDAMAAGTLEPEQPIYIVELAAGSGRFSYLFLKKLHALKDASSLRALDCRYVMTDFTQNNLRAWAAQPGFKPFVDSGLLHMGLFDAERDRDIKLVDGQVLSAATVKNPIVAIANYAFDTLAQDLFRVENGKLHEVRVSLRSSHAAPDLSRPEIMSELQCRYSQREVGTTYYDDPGLNRVLATYCARLADSTFAMPIGAFTAVRRLLEVSGRRLFLLSSDKGYTHEDELHQMSHQPIEFHGSLSMMVNYHAIGQYFTDHGGLYASTSPREAGLKTAAFVLGGDAARFADTLVTFRERADIFGPYDLFTLVGNQRKDSPAISPEHFLGLLRLTHYDPYIVHRFAPDVVGALQGAPEGFRLELRLALERVWDNYYPVGNDLPFDMARLYMALRRPVEGLRLAQRSIDLFGENAATYTNMGMCHYHAENPEAAVRCFDRAIELSPGFGVARAWRARVIGELERTGRASLASGSAPAARDRSPPGADKAMPSHTGAAVPSYPR